MSRPVADSKQLKLRLLVVAITAVALFVIVPHIGSFRSSLQTIGQARPGLLLAGLGCFGATYLAAALTYTLLAPRRLSYRESWLVAIASGFTGKLLPAGAGGIATYYLYLMKQRHTAGQAASVVAVNNILGFVGHSTIVLVAGLSASRQASLSIKPDTGTAAWVTAGLLLALLGAYFVLRPGKTARRLRTVLKTFVANLADYRQRPFRLLAAYLSSLLLTGSYAVCLYFCLQAVGGSLSWPEVVAVFTVGMAANSIAPTPGGIGAVEAGLVAAMVAYNVPAAVALAASLLFRLITYWLSIILGIGGLVVARRQKLV
ncbi:MAG: integral rane protein [Candidatus Saccharibacteria bacterium]|nr:integral rane protein [Candidatus Saccharibacteria bacterium]